MSLADDFRETARGLVKEFSGGEYTLKHLISSEYVPSTGVKTPTHVDYVVEMASEDIKDEKESGSISSDKHFKLIVDGLSLEEAGLTLIENDVPAIGDVIITPAGTSHQIAKVVFDQYKARYELYVHLKLWAV